MALGPCAVRTKTHIVHIISPRNMKVEDKSNTWVVTGCGFVLWIGLLHVSLSSISLMKKRLLPSDNLSRSYHIDPYRLIYRSIGLLPKLLKLLTPCFFFTCELIFFGNIWKIVTHKQPYNIGHVGWKAYRGPRLLLDEVPSELMQTVLLARTLWQGMLLIGF